jgi:hypothetical protein
MFRIGVCPDIRVYPDVGLYPDIGVYPDIPDTRISGYTFFFRAHCYPTKAKSATGPN